MYPGHFRLIQKPRRRVEKAIPRSVTTQRPIAAAAAFLHSSHSHLSFHFVFTNRNKSHRMKTPFRIHLILLKESSWKGRRRTRSYLTYRRLKTTPLPLPRDHLLRVQMKRRAIRTIPSSIACFLQHRLLRRPLQLPQRRVQRNARRLTTN